MNSIYNRTDEEFSVIGEVQANFIANDPLYQQGFKAGADSRDAEVQRLQMALADTEALELGTAEKCDQLRAHVNRLREALERIGRYPRVSGDELGYEGCRIVAREALATTPEQSLFEYRNKVIEE